MLRRWSDQQKGTNNSAGARSSGEMASGDDSESARPAATGDANSVLARPEAELRRESTGRESWVFRASRTSELLGVHAGEVGRALPAGETARYLLYSPMWEGSGGPFGIRAAPASHGMAVTERRFIISRDPHAAGTPPTTLSIPYETVLGVESGSALMLAWVVLWHAEAGAPQATTVLYRALGRKHVTALLRAYRAASSPTRLGDRDCLPAWAAVWDKLGARYREEIEPLLLDGERPLSAVAWNTLHGRWRNGRSDHVVSVAPAGGIVASSDGLFLVGEDPQTLQGSPGFGVNVHCVPSDALRAATLADVTTGGPWLLELRLALGRSGATETVLARFPGEQVRQVADALASVAGHLTPRGTPWSS